MATPPFPFLAVGAPLALGLGMLAVSPSATTLLLAACSPLIAAGTWAEQAIRARRRRRTATTDDAELPIAVRFAELAPGRLADAGALAEHWQDHDGDGGLPATIGLARDGPCSLDLRTDGPHALVAGTTGSGKSELLQAWVLALAAERSPARLHFLLVDYKGGAAFADCAELPHVAALVTDLTPATARRALVSLRAELRRRERVLATHRAKDLPALERLDQSAAPPALVIVIDEFAALATEIPEFVDGVVDIAQRGRSLGLHLVLATQRPAGVVKDGIRANANLRLALRVADPADSADVLGTPDAAAIGSGTPGRVLVRRGAAPAEAVQAAWLGGPEAVRALVRTNRRAAELLGIPSAGPPWREPLPALLPLDRVPAAPRHGLALGLIDQPERQRRALLVFDPARHGHLLLVGRSGSGKTTALRAVAAAAALGTRPCRVYAIDGGNGGLAPLGVLPTVGEVVPADDAERVTRLLTMLAEQIERRAGPRTLLLVDGFAALRERHERRVDDPVLPAVGRLLAEGRAAVVHLVVAADRPGAVPSAMLGGFGRIVALRQGTEADAALLGVDPRLLEDAQPGRGAVRGDAVQLAVPGRSARDSAQQDWLAGLGQRLRAAGSPDAPPVPVLEARIPLARLPPTIAGRPALGVAVTDLSAVGFPDRGVLLVAGGARSGRSTAIRTIRASLHRAGRPEPIVIERAHLLAEDAEAAAVATIRTARNADTLIVVELDPARIGTAWQLLPELRTAGAGLFLRADEADALGLLRVPLPRARRAGTPPGRAWLVEDGAALELQVALPAEDELEA